MFIKKIILTIFLFYLTKASAFKCYVCDEELDSECRDNPGPNHIQECEPRYSAQLGEYNSGTGCTVVISSYISNAFASKIQRDCYYNNISLIPSTEEYGCKVSDPNRFRLRSCNICAGTDSCNIEVFPSAERVQETAQPNYDTISPTEPIFVQPPSVFIQPPPVYVTRSPIHITPPPSFLGQIPGLFRCYVCDEELDRDCRNKLKPSFIKYCQTAYSEQFQKYNEGTGCATLISGMTNERNETFTKVQRDCYHGDMNLNPSFVEYGCRTSNPARFSPLNCFICSEQDACNFQLVEDDNNM